MTTNQEQQTQIPEEESNPFIEGMAYSLFQHFARYMLKKDPENADLYRERIRGESEGKEPCRKKTTTT